MKRKRERLEESNGDYERFLRKDRQKIKQGDFFTIAIWRKNQRKHNKDGTEIKLNK